MRDPDAQPRADDPNARPTDTDSPDAQPGRFNVLLTEDREQADEHWIHQLPRLLEPQGVATYRARSGREAISLAEHRVFHAAVLDLSMPFDLGQTARRGRKSAVAGGLDDADPSRTWVMELLRRLPNRPPMVLLRAPALDVRQAERMLREALRLGAFSVLDKPVSLEQLLAILQRLLERQYQGQWPSDRPGASGRHGQRRHGEDN